jgi:hypothetical protein
MIFTDAKDLRLGSVSAVAILASPSQYTVWGSGRITLTQPITGTTSFKKFGPLVLTLSGENQYSGGSYIYGSTTFVGTNSAFGTGNVYLSSCTLTNTGVLTLNNSISAAGNITIDLSGKGNFTLSSNISGSGNITNRNTSSPVSTLILSGNNSNFTGTFTQTNDTNVRTSFYSAKAGSENAAWTLSRNINGGVGINFSNDTLKFGSLAGGAFIRTNNSGTTTLEVGGLNTNTIFTGILQQSGPNNIISLNKVGTGTLTLNGFVSSAGSSPYAGNMTITNGTLSASNNFIVSNPNSRLRSAAFTPSTSTFTFSSVPLSAETYKVFNGPTTNLYPLSAVTLVGGGARAGSYVSNNSTLTTYPSSLSSLLSSCVMWIDATDSSTLALNGSLVSRIYDKSGNGNGFTQNTSINQPTYYPTGYLSGRPSLRFTASDIYDSNAKYMINDNGSYFANYTDSFSFFIICYQNAGSYLTIFSGSSNATFRRKFNLQLQNALGSFGLYHGPGDNYFTKLTSPTNAGYYAWSVSSPVNQTLYSSSNNSSSTTTGGLQFGTTGNTIFSMGDSQGFGAAEATIDGEISVLMMFNRAITQAEYTQLYNYYYNKIGS